jgi:hypothetical protein
LSQRCAPASVDGVVFAKEQIDFALDGKNADNAVILTPQEGDKVVRNTNGNYLLTVGVKF